MKPTDHTPSSGDALWQKLEAERAARAITARALAREARVPASTITRLKQGKTVTLETADRLFDWLGDERKAECRHEWRFAYKFGDAWHVSTDEVYYCSRCLERRRLAAA